MGEADKGSRATWTQQDEEEVEAQEEAMIRSARFSPCGRYRFELRRQWVDGPVPRTVTFVMLNPSTADAEQDDPTIRKCIGFAQRWEFEALVVVNVLAYCATKPDDIPSYSGMAIGIDNRKWLQSAILESELIVPAWGRERTQFTRAYKIARSVLYCMTIRSQQPTECLGFNRDGSPKHPLYIPYTADRVPFRPNC